MAASVSYQSFRTYEGTDKIFLFHQHFGTVFVEILDKTNNTLLQRIDSVAQAVQQARLPTDSTNRFSCTSGATSETTYRCGMPAN